MEFKFKKLSDVELIETTSDTTNILIEEDGKIKKIYKDEIGAQSDWNETDETNPAFILNKPTSLGGYAYYAVYSDNITKCDDCIYPADGVNSSTVTLDEFVEDYKSKPIMILNGDGDIPDGAWSNGIHPLVNCTYTSYSNQLDLVYFAGYSPTTYRVAFVE